MPDEAIDDVLASVRDQLHLALEAQFRALGERHEQELAAMREQAKREAAAEIDRVRAEAADSLAATRDELQQALATERQLAQARLDAERRNATEQLELARETFEAERAALMATPPVTASMAAGPLLEALTQVSDATSVSDTLAAMVRAAAANAGRAALFVANGSQLDEWTVAGVESLHADGSSGGAAPRGIITDALTSRTPARAADGAALAAPVLLDGTAVAVLYAERNGHDDPAWADALEAVARHGAAHLGYLTALRTAQARHWLSSGAAPAGTSASASDEGEAAARRYARLLVSELKLYNEAAVREGRDRGDLLQRLGPEIDRARRLYEERVPAAVPQRAVHFHDELVQTLAGGDPSRLG